MLSPREQIYGNYYIVIKMFLPIIIIAFVDTRTIGVILVSVVEVVTKVTTVTMISVSVDKVLPIITLVLILVRIVIVIIILTPVMSMVALAFLTYHIDWSIRYRKIVTLVRTDSLYTALKLCKTFYKILFNSAFLKS